MTKEWDTVIKKEQLTVWEHPDHTMQTTQYGSIPYSEWCEKEAARIKKGRGGKIYMATNQLTGSVCIEEEVTKRVRKPKEQTDG